MTGPEDSTADNADANQSDGQERLECTLCGADVPAASYHEHLLKECPGQ